MELNALIVDEGYIISKPKILDSICLWHRSWEKTSQFETDSNNVSFSLLTMTANTSS